MPLSEEDFASQNCRNSASSYVADVANHSHKVPAESLVSDNLSWTTPIKLLFAGGPTETSDNSLTRARIRSLTGVAESTNYCAERRSSIDKNKLKVGTHDDYWHVDRTTLGRVLISGIQSTAKHCIACKIRDMHSLNLESLLNELCDVKSWRSLEVSGPATRAGPGGDDSATNDPSGDSRQCPIKCIPFEGECIIHSSRDVGATSSETNALTASEANEDAKIRPITLRNAWEHFCYSLEPKNGEGLPRKPRDEPEPERQVQRKWYGCQNQRRWLQLSTNHTSGVRISNMCAT